MHPNSYCKTCGEYHNRGDLDPKYDPSHEPYDCDICCTSKKYEKQIEDLKKIYQDLLSPKELHNIGHALGATKGFYRNYFVTSEDSEDDKIFSNLCNKKLAEKIKQEKWNPMNTYIITEKGKQVFIRYQEALR